MKIILLSLRVFFVIYLSIEICFLFFSFFFLYFLFFVSGDIFSTFIIFDLFRSSICILRLIVGYLIFLTSLSRWSSSNRNLFFELKFLIFSIIFLLFFCFSFRHF